MSSSSLIMRSNSTGPVVKVILSSKYFRALAGSTVLNCVFIFVMSFPPPYFASAGGFASDKMNKNFQPPPGARHCPCDSSFGTVSLDEPKMEFPARGPSLAVPLSTSRAAHALAQLRVFHGTESPGNDWYSALRLYLE